MSLMLPKPVKRFKVPRRLKRRLPINHKRVEAKANGDLTREQWIEILRAYGFGCAYVGRHRGPIEQDHIIPISRGGTHTAENIASCCQRHNTVKGTQTWEPRPGHPYRTKGEVNDKEEGR